jgi:hypothetical protein
VIRFLGVAHATSQSISGYEIKSTYRRRKRATATYHHAAEWQDLMAALLQLVEVRQHLSIGTPLQQRVAHHVTNLRLFDMLAS